MAGQREKHVLGCAALVAGPIRIDSGSATKLGEVWLWQYTDGTSGPEPHTINGCDPMGIDISSYQGTAEQLAAEWAGAAPAPPEPTQLTVTIIAPAGVKVEVKNAPLG